jgi:hypothetical protein
MWDIQYRVASYSTMANSHCSSVAISQPPATLSLVVSFTNLYDYRIDIRSALDDNMMGLAKRLPITVLLV